MEEFALKLNEADFYEKNICKAIGASQASHVEVLGIKVKTREVNDCPDVTQGHYVVGKFFDDILVPDRRNVVDCPGVTPSHLVASKAFNLEYLESLPNIVDVGCGTGFIGNFLGKNACLENLIFSDLSSASLDLARRTYEINSVNGFRTFSEKVSFREGDAINTLGDLDGGMMVCAPYLIPEVCTMFLGVYNLFANVANNQGMDLYIGHSSLSQKMVEEAGERSGMRVSKVFEKKDVLLSPEYACDRFPNQIKQKKDGVFLPATISKLSKLGLRGDGGKYFHDIVVSKLSEKD